MMKPAEKAAATRRIRRRAQKWKAYTQRLASPTAEQVAAHLSEATQATWTRPPLSREAIAWAQMQHLNDAYSQLARCRRNGGKPYGIGSVRAARLGMAALLAALDTVDSSPKPTRVSAIGCGDMIARNGSLHRVIGREGETLHLEGGESLALQYGDEIEAIRPADARQFREDMEARAAAESQRLERQFRTIFEAFDSSYNAAWQAKDWHALRIAVTLCHAAFPALEGKYGTARQLITHRATIARTGKPPKYPQHTRCAKGFAQHVKNERALRERLAWLNEVGGGDVSQVAKVKDWRGRVMRVSGDALRNFRCDWIPRVNAAGIVTSRTERIRLNDLVQVMPDRRITNHSKRESHP